MAKIISQFANIFIHYYSNRTSSACKLFISEPTQNQERLLGRLFGIIEINVPSRENNNIINLLISSLEDIYYGYAENEDIDPNQCFEDTLKLVNHKFIQMIKDRQIALVGNLNENTVKEKMNLAIGILKENQLHISYLNNINIFLVHKAKQDYKIIDIKKVADGETDSNGAKESSNLFANLISGEINAPDYLIMANGNFLEYISLERIQKILTSLPLHKATEYFKNSLLQHEGQNFAAILMKNTVSESDGMIKEPASLTSITELNYTESATEKLLAPSIWGLAKNASGKIKKYFRQKPAAPKIDGGKTADKIEAEDASRTNTPAAKKISLPKFALGLKIKKAYYLFFSSNSKIGGIVNNLKNKFQLRLNISKNRLRQVPNLSKILLAVGGIMIVLFILSIVIFKQKQTQTVFQKEYEGLIAQIEQKKSEAESDLIYGDEAKSNAAISEAQRLLATLPIESQKQKEVHESLNNGIMAIVAKLRHITIIEEPVLITDLSALQSDQINIQNIVYQNSAIYAFDSIKNGGYAINPETKEVKQSASNLADIGSIVRAKVVNGKILIYHDKNAFVLYQDQKYSPFPVGLNPEARVTDFTDYNGRLYSLDALNSQIYRQPANLAGGYDAGLKWLNQSYDLKDTVSMAIDLNIWLLDKKGQILKFTKGTKRDFTLNKIEPILEEPTRLFTNDATNYLYILEPKNKRIVVTDKNGELKIQYFSESFDNLQDLIIIENEKKAFVSSDNKIYFFNLTHL